MPKKTKKSPDKLTKAPKSGVALTEAELGQAKGGLKVNQKI